VEQTTTNAKLIGALLTEYNLSPRTRSFVLSVRAWNDRRPLTDKQLEALYRIKYSYENPISSPSESWIREWSDSKKEIATVCAQYYSANPPYFNDIAHRILTDVEYVPTKYEYEKLVTNKYSKKVLQEYRKPVIFNTDTVVGIRVPAARKLGMEKLIETPMIIIKTSAAPITSAAIGAKKHLVLPIGTEIPLLIEERYLKKIKL